MTSKSKLIIIISSAVVCCVAAALIIIFAVIGTGKKTYDMSGVVFADTTVTYDGAEHSIEAKNLPEGVVATYEGNGAVNAGTYTVTAHFEGKGKKYNPIPDMTATLVINKATYDMSKAAFEDDVVEYDGLPHSIEAASLPTGVTATYEGNGKTAVGTYSVTAHFSGDSANYNPIPDKTVTLTINKRVLGIQFNGERTIVYNGLAHKNFTASLTNLVGDDELEVTLSYSGDMIEAGKYVITATIEENDKYVLTKSNTCEVTITRAVHTVTFRQEGQADKTITVPDLAGVKEEDIPQPVGAVGYTVTWERKNLTSVTEDIIVNAVKSAILYQIHYHPNGTQSADDYTESYTIESITKKLESKTRRGYTFDGWYTDEDFNNRIEEIVHGSYGDIDLYAKWTIDNYTITYHLNDGTNDNSNPATYTVNDSVTLADASKRGYTFEGWFTDDIYTERFNGLEKGSIGNIDVYAKWDIVEYDIIYHLGEGTNNADNLTKYTVITPLTALKAPTNAGFEFGGWFDNNNFTGSKITAVAGGQIGKIELYARWIVVKLLSVTGFELDGSEMTVSGEVAFTTDSVDFTDIVTVSEGCTWKLFADEDMNSEYADKTLPLHTGENIAYIAVLHSDGEHVAIYSLIINRQSKKTYKFMDWDSTDEMPYDSGELEEPAVVNEPQKPKPEREHYTFEGWIVEGGDEVISFPYTIPAEVASITFVAKYTPVSYDIIYHIDISGLEGPVNGEGNPNSYTIEFNDTITLNDATWDQVEFLGWYTNASFAKDSKISQITIEKIKDITQSALGEIHLYGKWGGTRGLQYSDDNTKVIGYEGTATVIVIPAENGDVPVTAIEGKSGKIFENNKALKVVVIGENITAIEDGTFEGCDNLTTVIWNATNCSKQADAIFLECSALKKVVFGEHVETIPAGFRGTGLESITIGEKVKTIGEFAFSECTSLKTVIWNAIDCKEAGSSTSNRIFSGSTNITTVEFGEKVQIIPAYLFMGCTELERVIIPESVTNIGERAFNGCSNLKSINIPEGVKEIGSGAFGSCTSLTTVFWNAKSCNSNSMTVFGSCKNLKVVIGNAVNSISNNIFNNCTIAEVYYEGTAEQWNGITFNNNSTLKNATRYNADEWHYNEKGEPEPLTKED